MSSTNDSELSSSSDTEDDRQPAASRFLPPMAPGPSQLSRTQLQPPPPPVLIEEVSGDNLAAAELSQFVIAQIPPMPGPSRTSHQQPHPAAARPTQRAAAIEIPAEQEAVLIKKLINGELSFLEYNRQVGQILADSIDEEEEEEEVDDELDENMDMDVDMGDEDPGNATHSKAGLHQPPHRPSSASSASAAASRFTSHPSSAASSAHFERELLQSRRNAIRGQLQGNRTGNKSARRRCVLPAALQGLMGSANLCYARGEVALAEKACLEIIRQVPLAPEPFLTLAQIHEHNPDKFMQFSLIAAHLNPHDADQWCRIAQVSLEQGNIAQAINCYTKATRYNPHENGLRLERIRLLKQIGEEKVAFRVYCTMLGYIPAAERDFLLDTAKLVANQWLSDKQPARALDAMRLAYDRLAGQLATADLNFYLELLVEQQEYGGVLGVLREHTAVRVPEVAMGTGVEQPEQQLFIPPDICLDFRAKLIVSLIRMRRFELLEALFADIFAHIHVEDAGDCYLDIAEALIAEQRYADALRLLVPLVRSENYSLAAVWLRHADCHRAIGNVPEAIDSYRQVVRLAPQHFDARLTLSALLKQMGRHAEAMQALEQDMDSELIDPQVLYERCYMLREIGNWAQFLDTGILLLSRHGVQLRNVGEMVVAAKIAKLSTKLQMIAENRAERLEPVEDVDGPEFVSHSKEQRLLQQQQQLLAGLAATDLAPGLVAEWQLFHDLMQVACEQRQWPALLKCTLALLTCKVFAPYKADVWFMCAMASVYGRNPQFSLLLVKELLEKNVTVPRAWNLFCVVTQYSDSTWYGRYLFRLFKRHRIQSGAPLLMRANYFMLSGSLKYAINDYVQVYKTCDAPLVPLMLSLTFAHMAQQKHIQKKHQLMVQSIAFATKYRARREREAWHEVQYNLGRLYQAFGAVHLAVEHYGNVLRWRGEWQGEDEAVERLLGLRQEAAFNLHLLYVQSGNAELARKVLHEHLVV